MLVVRTEAKWNEAVVKRFRAAAAVDGVEVGYREDERYPDGESVRAVALAQEFGTPKIPPRPWIRPTLDSRKGRWARAVATALKGAAKSEAGLRSMWQDRGREIVESLRHGIDKANNPPLSAHTIARRMARGNSSVKPLVDTGKMRNGLSFRVAGEEWQS